VRFWVCRLIFLANSTTTITQEGSIMKSKMLKFFPAIAVATAIGLAGCGGGSDDSQAPTSAPVIGQNGAVAVGDYDASDASCDIASFAPSMLAAVNSARSVARNCGSTAYAAASPLGWNALLGGASAAHAADMASNNAVSATLSTGETLTQFVDATDYEYAALGENVGRGYTTVAKLMDAMLASEEHCKKIMSSVLTEMGAACVKSGTGTNYWSQIFSVHKSVN
jgi:uncharacterized protein YkwD